jgi:hypothetical protein
MPEVEQVLYGRRCCARIVDPGRMERGVVHPEHSDGHAQGVQHLGLCVGEHQAGDDERVHPLAHRHLGEEPVAAGGVAQVVQQQVERGVMKHGLDRTEDLGEVPTIDEGNHYADGCGAAAGQASRERRGYVVQFTSGGKDAIASGGSDVR